MFAGIGGFRSGMEKVGHKCVGWVEWDRFARQSYEAIYNTKGLYTANDIREIGGAELPSSNVWCFGFPCQDVSVAGKQKGIQKGTRSGLFFEVIRLLEERIENSQKIPEYLFVENVKNLLSIDGGWGFARVQIEMDKVGYDTEWCVLNSSDVVPQNRERVYIVGHLRGKRSRQVFPIIRQSGTANKEQSKIKIVGNTSKTEHHSDDVMDEIGVSKTITAENAYKHTPQVAIHQAGNYIKTESFGGNPQVGRVYNTDGLAPTLNTMQGGGREPKVLVKPCLTPDRLNKHQNGRRFKDNKEPSFTVTAQDRQGVLVEKNNSIAIRKLTPLECWRLQGFDDKQFYKAKNAGLSNTQLYKQAGNAVTVPVVEAIAEKMSQDGQGVVIRPNKIKENKTNGSKDK